MKVFLLIALCGLLSGCVALHLRHRKWPESDDVKTWHYDWQGDERDGCNYRDWYKREACARRHAAIL